jgi:type II secretory pathway component PulJ
VILGTGNGGEVTRAASIMLAGVPMRDQDVLELARLLRDAGFDDTPRRSSSRWRLNRQSLPSRFRIERILRSLQDPPKGVAELRGVLLTEHEWRERNGPA